MIFFVQLLYSIHILNTWLSYREELKEVPSVQAQEAVHSVVAEDGRQVPVLQWEVVGNVPHRHVFCYYVIVTWILWKWTHYCHISYCGFSCLMTQTGRACCSVLRLIKPEQPSTLTLEVLSSAKINAHMDMWVVFWDILETLPLTVFPTLLLQNIVKL